MLTRCAGIELKCDVDIDPFLFMEANNKVYGFTIALYEYERTIQTLSALFEPILAV